MHLKFHGHSTIELRIKNNVIYIDPYLDPFSAETQAKHSLAGHSGTSSASGLPKADLILISHAGYDHCSIETIRLLSNDNTIVLGTRNVSSLIHNCSTINAGDIRDFNDFKVKALNAVPYNEKHVEGSVVGFGISADGKTIFYPSDTKYLQSMTDIKPDIMLIAVGGTLTMNAKEAANFVLTLMPKIAIPIHYGRINGTIDDAQYFKELVEAKQETKVIILKEDEEVEL